MTDFAKRIRQRRIALNLTQKQVAAVCGVNRSTICYYEDGKREPTLSTLIGLAKALKVDLAWLTGQKEDICKAANVPVYKIPKPGEPLETEENIIGEEMVDETEDIMFCFIAKDNSMAGIRVFIGDFVYIKKLEKLSSSDVVLVEVPEHGILLRRVIYNYKKDHIFFNAEDPAVPDLVFKIDQNPQYRIIGKWTYK